MRKELKEKKKKWEEEGKKINDRIKTLERVCVCELLRIEEKKGRRENRRWKKGEEKANIKANIITKRLREKGEGMEKRIEEILKGLSVEVKAGIPT